MKVISGGVTQPKGYVANGLFCGIKRSGKPDLALIYSQFPAVCAGVFTKNSVKAAPLLVCQNHLRDGKAQAVIANSGNANCFTGKFGLIYAQQTSESIAQWLGIKAQDVLVASTGIIGKTLPFKKIEGAVPLLVKGLSKSGGKMAAEAIMTTDLTPKEIAVTVTIGNKKVTIGACAKGSGMIAPNMATMLAFITSDIAISASMLKRALKAANEKSFNCITVDGCMSTNDMVTVMANGQAGNPVINRPGKNFDLFYEALEYVCVTLAKRIIKDGEGATKFVEITVKGAASPKIAKTAALAVANSALVKTAAYGSNPNWGRVAAAVGALGLKVSEHNLRIKFSSFAKKEIKIWIDLNLGRHQATVYTCDLSLDYVKINGAYN